MARAPDPNLGLLIAVAQALGELRERFVFVGGCATGLLITDPAAPAARPTRDVDVIVEAGALLEYREIGRALQAKGFSQPLAAGDPPYRWTGRDGSKLDVMPTEEAILGFSNRWYRDAIRTAREIALRERLSIRPQACRESSSAPARPEHELDHACTGLLGEYTFVHTPG